MQQRTQYLRVWSTCGTGRQASRTIGSNGMGRSYTAAISPFTSLAMERFCHSIRSFASWSVTSVSSCVSTATMIFDTAVNIDEVQQLCALTCVGRPPLLLTNSFWSYAQISTCSSYCPHHLAYPASCRTRCALALRGGTTGRVLQYNSCVQARHCGIPIS